MCFTSVSRGGRGGKTHLNLVVCGAAAPHREHFSPAQMPPGTDPSMRPDLGQAHEPRHELIIVPRQLHGLPHFLFCLGVCAGCNGGLLLHL